MKTVCLFCASLDGKDPFFSKNANDLGQMLAKKKYSFLYGGGSLGLMGIAAKSALKNKVKVISVIPEYLDKPSIIFSKSDEIIKTKTLSERKEKMINISDIFIALPGGVGTLDEVTDVIAGAALGEHQKPIFLVNINNFWDPFIQMIEHMKKSGLIRSEGDENLNHSSLKNLFVIKSLDELSNHPNF